MRWIYIGNNNLEKGISNSMTIAVYLLVAMLLHDVTAGLIPRRSLPTQKRSSALIVCWEISTVSIQPVEVCKYQLAADFS
jgi:hypothetical protein